jgi:colicin import membrane protein
VAARLLSAGGFPTGDRVSLAWSLAGHAVLVAVLVLGGLSFWRPSPPATIGIEATVVDPRDLRRPVRSRPEPRPAPPPEPAPEPAAEVEERRAAEARAEQERRQAEAAEAERRAEQKRSEQQAAERKAAEQRAAEKQAAQKQVADKKAAEKKAADQAAAAKKAAAEKAAAEKQAADKAAAARKAEQAARDAEDARRRAAASDLARQLAEEERLAAAADSGALAEYVGLIRQKVERNWVPPGSARPGLECEVIVNQLPGGQVGDVRLGRCNGDDAVRRSIEAAVRRSDPLPLPADPALFERNLRFTFKPEE